MRKLVLAAVFCALGVADASAQQQATRPPAPITTGDFLAQGFEIKGVINNTYLLLQKGERTFLCGTADNLTWTNWAEVTRDAPCKPMTRTSSN